MESDASARPCPVCGEDMDVQAIEDIEIDVCGAHGVWLDNGEMERILQLKRAADGEGRVQLRSARIRRARKRRAERHQRERDSGTSFLPMLFFD